MHDSDRRHATRHAESCFEFGPLTSGRRYGCENTCDGPAVFKGKSDTQSSSHARHVVLRVRVCGAGHHRNIIKCPLRGARSRAFHIYAQRSGTVIGTDTLIGIDGLRIAKCMRVPVQRSGIIRKRRLHRRIGNEIARNGQGQRRKRKKARNKRCSHEPGSFSE